MLKFISWATLKAGAPALVGAAAVTATAVATVGLVKQYEAKSRADAMIQAAKQVVPESPILPPATQHQLQAVAAKLTAASKSQPQALTLSTVMAFQALLKASQSKPALRAQIPAQLAQLRSIQQSLAKPPKKGSQTGVSASVAKALANAILAGNTALAPSSPTQASSTNSTPPGATLSLKPFNGKTFPGSSVLSSNAIANRMLARLKGAHPKPTASLNAPII